eukprot:25996-Pelagococcus_subviridis.AAC.2
MTSAPASMAGKLCVVTGANSGIGLARPRDPDHRRPNGTLDPPTSSSTLVVVSLSSSVATHRRLHVPRLLLRPHRRKSRASSRPGARASSWRAATARARRPRRATSSPPRATTPWRCASSTSPRSRPFDRSRPGSKARAMPWTSS